MNIFKCILLLMILISSCTENSEEPTSPSSADYTQVDFEPAWSNDGNKIIFAHSNVDHERSGIYIINPNGTGSTQLVEEFSRSPEWLNNASEFLFSQFNNINKFYIPSDSQSVLISFGTCYYPKVNQTLNKIAFSSYNGNFTSICVAELDGSGIQTVESNADYPDWINGQNELLFLKPIYINNSRSGDTLIKHSLTTGNKVVIKILNGDDHLINSYPVDAGDAIIFCSMNSGGYNYIYRMNYDGSNVIRLTQSQGYSPDYCFQNGKIAYTNRDPGNGRIWIMNKDGSGKMQVSN